MKKQLHKFAIALALASPVFGSYAADTGANTKTLSVYTTAKDTNHKLSLTDTLNLKPAQQFKETDVAVYVNPAEQYQTFLGIGGAITDASAETLDAASGLGGAASAAFGRASACASPAPAPCP